MYCIKYFSFLGVFWFYFSVLLLEIQFFLRFAFVSFTNRLVTRLKILPGCIFESITGAIVDCRVCDVFSFCVSIST